MEKETWKDVVGYEGDYEISNSGVLKSLKFGRERIIKPGLNIGGYKIANLTKDGKSKTRTIHQLVAEAFLNHTPNGVKWVVNHKNFNKIDNRVENLEIVSQRQNVNKKHIKGSSEYVGVHYYKKTKKWKTSIYINGKSKFLGCFDTELEAHNAYQLEFLKIKESEKPKHKIKDTVKSGDNIPDLYMDSDNKDCIEAEIISGDFGSSHIKQMVKKNTGKNISKREIAKIGGVSQTLFYHWEKNQQNITKFLAAISNHFGIPINELLNKK